MLLGGFLTLVPQVFGLCQEGNVKYEESHIVSTELVQKQLRPQK